MLADRTDGGLALPTLESDPWPLEGVTKGVDDNEGVEGIEAIDEPESDPSNAMAMVPKERVGELRETLLHVAGN